MKSAIRGKLDYRLRRHTRRSAGMRFAAQCFHRLRTGLPALPGRITLTCAALAAGLFVSGDTKAADAQAPTAGGWRLADPREVRLEGSLGEACRLGADRLSQDPYRSAAFLRSDFSFETNRVFVNYSGDISGRFLEIASLLSPPGRMSPATLPEVLQNIGSFQRADGHFGREVNWNDPLEPENPNAKLLPIFWGNSRLLLGLLEAHRAFDRPDLLAITRRLGDFYVNTADRFLDPNREKEYRSTGTYAAGYVTDYFPGIESLARLCQVTREPRYLVQAERMAAFFKRFDTLPIDHSHGNLTTHRGLLLLYEATGKADYLDRVQNRWREAVEGGYVWPLGGVGEKFRVSNTTDEGCSESDWLQLCLKLWKLTSEPRYLDAADRLLWNHYAMNRTANGGYGHHNFVCDAEGPLLMKPECTEAVWCCTFHGLLGLHTLKSHVLASSGRRIAINFPVPFSATITADGGAWQVTSEIREQQTALTCRVRLGLPGASSRPPEILMRVPSWADSATAMDHQGRKLSPRLERGYLSLPVQPGPEGEVVVTLSRTPRVENRRLGRLDLAAGSVTRHRGVVLFNGPHILLASSEKPRPTVVALVGEGGALRLPVTEDGSCPLVNVPDADATEAQIAEAAQSSSRLALGPWERTRRDAPAAFVFDLVTVPESSPLAKSWKR